MRHFAYDPANMGDNGVTFDQTYTAGRYRGWGDLLYLFVIE